MLQSVEPAWCLGAWSGHFFNHPVGPVCQSLFLCRVHLAFAGPDSYNLERHIHPLCLCAVKHLHELPFHIFQVLPFIGTELVQHPGFLGNGINRCPS